MRLRSLMALAVMMVVLAPIAAAAQTEVNPQITDMTAQQKAEMEAMTKAAAVGKQHQWLGTLAGKWDFIARVFPAPGAPPMESKGWAERTPMLGGRVLAENVHGEVMGSPFEGHGMSGYDNVTGKFWGTWSDNMSTGVMVSWGTCDDQGTCTFTGQYSDPMTGQMKTSKMISKHMGNTEHHEFWETRDGKEVKTFELDYRRQ
jgi:hypothetical protein